MKKKIASFNEEARDRDDIGRELARIKTSAARRRMISTIERFAGLLHVVVG